MQRDIERLLREERRRELSEEPQQRRRLMGLPRGRHPLPACERTPYEAVQNTRLPFARRRVVETQLSL